jgi:Fe-S-cluster containining protein
MKCDEGCGRCCGVVPATDKEYEAIIRYAEKAGIVPIAQGITCPFFQGGRCAVYEARPLICRMFGHSPLLSCLRDYNTNISDGIERKLIRENGPPSHLLHEVLERSGIIPDWAEYVRKVVDDDEGVPHEP